MPALLCPVSRQTLFLLNEANALTPNTRRHIRVGVTEEFWSIGEYCTVLQIGTRMK
jgi:hypothetical protein